MSSRTSDVLVVGGGIIGLVTAWRAAQRGLTTAVVDPEPGGGAAQVAAGMLAAVTELHYGERTLLGLNLASAHRYPDFAAELTELTGHDLGYRRCGTLAVALDADDRAHLRELHALQRQSGLESEWLSGREGSRRGCAAGCGWTATIRSIRAASRARCWPPASGWAWSSTAHGPNAFVSSGTGPPGSPPRTARNWARTRWCSPPAASAAAWKGSRGPSCLPYGP